MFTFVKTHKRSPKVRGSKEFLYLLIFGNVFLIKSHFDVPCMRRFRIKSIRSQNKEELVMIVFVEAKFSY